MNYKLVENKGKFFVFEKPTMQKISKTYDTKEEARSFLRHLNLGGGFDGWTPAFMTEKYFFDQAGKIVLDV